MSRDLARQLHVSRNTVLQAYERLCAEGYLLSRGGSGTFVCDGLARRPFTAPAHSPLRPREIWNDIPSGLDMGAATAAFDFRPGIPDASRFPYAPWRARVSRQLYHHAIGTGVPIGAAGDVELRAALARHIAVARAVRATAEDVLVTSGSQQAIDLIAKVLLATGDTVSVEDPGYPLPRRAFNAHGCHVRGVPVDEDGLIVDAIPNETRLIFVTPSHQYPLGTTMSMARRRALLDWAERSNATIVETITTVSIATAAAHSIHCRVWMHRGECCTSARCRK
ncbi:MAG: aminotransferase-like domain-containing protein [Gemmatimonadaceae bacterium]